MTPQIMDLNDPEFKKRLASIHHRAAPSATEAYVHRGMWVADCPYPSCSNAERLDMGESGMHCTACHWVGGVTWPPDAAAIDVVLDMRPVPETRHWAPAGHRQAIACGFPDGQSVDDLIVENEENL